MFRIRPAQLQAFQDAADARLVRYLRGHVRRHDGETVAAMPDAELDHKLLTSVRRARLHGIDDALSIAEFFMAMLRFGPLFDQIPSAAAILVDTTRPPNARIHAVWQSLRAELQTAAPREPPPWWEAP